MPMEFFRDVFKTRDITNSKRMDFTPYNIMVIIVRLLIIAFIFLTVSRYVGI
jgi:preprotein translocase subunit SecE